MLESHKNSEMLQQVTKQIEALANSDFVWDEEKMSQNWLYKAAMKLKYKKTFGFDVPQSVFQTMHEQAYQSMAEQLKEGKPLASWQKQADIDSELLYCGAIQ